MRAKIIRILEKIKWYILRDSPSLIMMNQFRAFNHKSEHYMSFEKEIAANQCEIIIGERVSGKSTYLIKKAAKTKNPIVVSDQKRKEALKSLARNMGKEVKIYSMDEAVHGWLVGYDMVLIDDLEAVLRKIFNRPIRTLSINRYCIKHEYLSKIKYLFRKK